MFSTADISKYKALLALGHFWLGLEEEKNLPKKSGFELRGRLASRQLIAAEPTHLEPDLGHYTSITNTNQTNKERF